MAVEFNRDISSWDVSSVTAMGVSSLFNLFFTPTNIFNVWEFFKLS